MKTIRITIFFLLAATVTTGAQNINWANLKVTDRHLLNGSVGVEYGMVAGFVYGYRLNTKLPVILNAGYSMPFGEKVFDDLKTSVGGQVEILRFGDFRFSARVNGLFRLYNNRLVRMANFGSDLSAVAGYYKSRWFIAGEAGFDKAIVTHFRHTTVYRAHFPEAVDGWYQPATGGNFYYGALMGVSIGRADVYVNAGKIATEDFRSAPYMPFYGKIGLTYKL
jgi:hypothetical protein